MEKCKNLESIRYQAGNNFDITLDFSESTSLIYVDTGYQSTANFILPASCRYAYFGSFLRWVDFSNCSHLKMVYMSGMPSLENRKKTLSSFKSTCIVDDLQIRKEFWNDQSDVSLLKELTTTNILRFYMYPSGDNTSIKSLSGIEKLVNMKMLKIVQYVNLSDISALSGLTNLEVIDIENTKVSDISVLASLPNLKSLDLRKNSIANLLSLESLSHLGEQYIDVTNGNSYYGTLQLENNCLSDTFSYVDGENGTKVRNNLEILANLNINKGGNLTSLYLAGNSGIIDFSKVSSLTWSRGKSGF